MITYYLATNEVDIFHYGEMVDGMEVSTGQPKLFFYNTKQELADKLAMYGQDYQEPIRVFENPQTSIEDLPLLPEE